MTRPDLKSRPPFPRVTQLAFELWLSLVTIRCRKQTRSRLFVLSLVTLNQSTGEAICRSVGVFSADESLIGKSFTGAQFMAMSHDDQLRAVSSARSVWWGGEYEGCEWRCETCD